ncbi:MAG TPA: rhamnan synthesis F family protein, partial [Rhizobiaceae bacterium]
KDLATPFATRMGIDLDKVSGIDFPSGSMFWARPRALRPLLDLNLLPSDFPDEQGQLTLTSAHAIERLFFLSSEAAGMKWLKVAIPSAHPTTARGQQISSRSNLRRFVEARNVALMQRDVDVGYEGQARSVGVA